MNTMEERERELFDEWARNYPSGFYRDGVPSPDHYRSSRVKVVLVLREANFKNEQGEVDLKHYDFRDELRNDPQPFWCRKISPLCYGLIKSTDDLPATWAEASAVSHNRSECIAVLNRFGFVQMKKSPGSSVINPELLVDAARSEQALLRRQFEIYQPDIIVACGISFPRTFDLLTQLVFPQARDCTHEASFQRRCAVVQAGKVDGSPTFLIETLHPSHRLERKPVFDKLKADYRQAVELLRQFRTTAPAATN
jgi:hypothetical protein